MNVNELIEILIEIPKRDKEREIDVFSVHELGMYIKYTDSDYIYDLEI